jgi:hypothetical protein
VDRISCICIHGHVCLLKGTLVVSLQVRNKGVEMNGYNNYLKENTLFVTTT